MLEHLPAFQIILPMMAAPLCLIIRQKVLVQIWASIVAWISCIIAWSIVLRVYHDGQIAYHLGDWAPSMGIEYRIDAANAFILLIVTGIASVVFPYGIGKDGVSGPEGKEYLFYAALLLCMTGLLGITITGDAFNVFVFLEVTSLSSYALVSMGKGRRAKMAAFSYLIMGTIGGTFILVGIGFLFAIAGTLNMAEIAAILSKPGVASTSTAIVSFGFLVVGVGIKLAVFPLYQWLPNAYSYTPSKVSAFLSATATKVSYYVLLRIMFGIFGAVFVFKTISLDQILMPLSIVAMFVGSIAAIYQTNIKRLLAYSSIAQVGYMTLGISLLNMDALTGGIVHLFNHAVMKCGLFLVVGCIVYRIGSTQIQDMKGLMKQMPLTMAAFIVGGLSLIGVPGTVGFVSKWYLVLGAIKAEQYTVAGLTLLSSLLAVMYVWKVVEVAVFSKPEGEPKRTMAPMSMLIPTWFLMGAAIYYGLDTEVTVGIAQRAAEAMLGAASTLTSTGGLP